MSKPIKPDAELPDKAISYEDWVSSGKYCLKCGSIKDASDKCSNEGCRLKRVPAKPLQ